MSLDAPKVIPMTTLGYHDNGGAFLKKANRSASPSQKLTSPSLRLEIESSRQAHRNLTASSLKFIKAHCKLTEGSLGLHEVRCPVFSPL